MLVADPDGVDPDPTFNKKLAPTVEKKNKKNGCDPRRTLGSSDSIRNHIPVAHICRGVKDTNSDLYFIAFSIRIPL